MTEPVLGQALGVLPVEHAEGGYLWPEFAPHGGPLLLLRSAPFPRAVLEVEQISPEEAWALDNAADPSCGVDLTVLDEVCLGVMVRGAAPPSV